MEPRVLSRSGELSADSVPGIERQEPQGRHSPVPAPLLGVRSREVLTKGGFSEQEIDAGPAAGVISDSARSRAAPHTQATRTATVVTVAGSSVGIGVVTNCPTVTVQMRPG